VVGLLNSDDVYAPGAFAAAAQTTVDPAVEMVIGGAEVFALRDGQEPACPDTGATAICDAVLQSGLL
jgi:hypothetical protein